MIKVSKNKQRGKKLGSVTELLLLAEQRKAVCYLFYPPSYWKVKPASVMINWPLAKLLQMTFWEVEDIQAQPEKDALPDNNLNRFNLVTESEIISKINEANYTRERKLWEWLPFKNIQRENPSH